MIVEKDVKFRQRYESPPVEKPSTNPGRNLHFWKSCLSDNPQRRERRSLSADDSSSIRSALIEHKSETNLSTKKSKKKSAKSSDENSEKKEEKNDLAEDVPIPFYFSPTRYKRTNFSNFNLRNIFCL